VRPQRALPYRTVKDELKKGAVCTALKNKDRSKKPEGALQLRSFALLAHNDSLLFVINLFLVAFLQQRGQKSPDVLEQLCSWKACNLRTTRILTFLLSWIILFANEMQIGGAVTCIATARGSERFCFPI
jgi:hypothetical protein